LLLQPSHQPEEDETDGVTLAEAKEEEAYRALEGLLSRRVAGQTEPALEAKIEAYFKALAQRKQERPEAGHQIKSRITQFGCYNRWQNCCL
jgi:hypothetical protein